MRNTRDPPSTTIDGTDESYRAEPPLDAESTGGTAIDGGAAAGSAPTDGAAVGSVPDDAPSETDPARPAGSIATADPTPAPDAVATRTAESTAIGATESPAPTETESVEAGATGAGFDLLQSLVALASGSPFVAAIAAVETVIATVLLGVPHSPAPIVVGLVTFAVYTVDHVTDAAADARSTPERARIARRYGDQLMIVAAVTYGLAVALATLGGPLALGVALLPGAFWIAYASDWLPNVGRTVRSIASEGVITTGVRLPRLKEVPVVGSAVVAAGWAIAVTLLPLAFAGSAVPGSGPLGAAPLEPVVAVAFAYFFLRSFVDAELPNVRDVEADAAAGVSTLPIALGVPWTRRVLYGIDLLTAATLATATAAGVLAAGVAAALGVGVAVSLGVTALAGRVDDAAVLGVAPDCSYLVVGGALVVAAA